MKTNILVVDTKICSTFTHHSMNSAEMKNNYSIYVTNAPPKERNTNTCCLCFSFLFIEGFERLGSRRVNEIVIISPQRAGQTIDGTIVCEPGVIANNVCGANPSASANQNLNRIRECSD